MNTKSNEMLETETNNVATQEPSWLLSSPIAGQGNVSSYLQNLKKHNIENDVQFLLSHILLSEHLSYLDVGFGSGVLLKQLMKRQPNNTFVGIEYSHEMYDSTSPSMNDMGIETRHVDYFHYVPKHMHNAVIFSFVLHHFKSLDLSLERALSITTHDAYIYIADRISDRDSELQYFPKLWNTYYCNEHEWNEDCPHLYSIESIQRWALVNELELVSIDNNPYDIRLKSLPHYPKRVVVLKRK